MPEITATGRRAQIVEAAVGVFLRYGYARTTMADIAREVGLTRPTVYGSFPDKEHIFAAVVEKMIADKLLDIREGLNQQSALRDKLLFACHSWASEGYELVKAHPDAADMFDLGFRSVCAGYDAFGAIIEELLEAPLAASDLEISAAEATRALVFAMRGFKEIAKDAADMRAMVSTQVSLMAAGIQSNSTS